MIGLSIQHYFLLTFLFDVVKNLLYITLGTIILLAPVGPDNNRLVLLSNYIFSITFWEKKKVTECIGARERKTHK